MTDMLRSVGPSVAQGRDTTLLREILDQTAERVEDELDDQPEVAAAVARTADGSTPVRRIKAAVKRSGLRLNASATPVRLNRRSATSGSAVSIRPRSIVSPRLSPR